MKKQLRSFRAAFSGFAYTVKHESHMRFHLVAGFHVIIFGLVYGLSAAQWAVILLLTAAVIAAELFNTSLETLCNRSVEGYDAHIKIAKDAAAAAVLVLSAAAVVIAAVFFLDFGKLTAALGFFLNRPALLILFVLSLIISLVFIVPGKAVIGKIFRKSGRK